MTRERSVLLALEPDFFPTLLRARGAQSRAFVAAIEADLIGSPHLVVSVLNDLFGIQARGGCFCAGPYLQRLSGMDDESVEAILCEVPAGARAPSSAGSASTSTTSSARRRPTT